MTTPYRAAWAAIAFAMLFPTLVTWVYFVALADSATELQQTAYGIGKTLQFVFPIAWALVIERYRVRITRPQRAGLVEGIVFGVMIFAGALALYYAWLNPIGYLSPASAAGEAVRRKVASFGVQTVLGYAALGTFYSVVHSFLEEYYWRWFVFGRLRERVSLGVAIVVSSLGFMLHHILVLGFYLGWLSPATWLFSLAVAIGGAAWAWIYHRSDSLWGPWLSHLLIDAAIFAVGYDLVRPMLA